MSFFRSLGPVAAHASPKEALRAGIGAFVGLCLAGFFALSPTIDLQLGLYLVAPFGASAVLLFAVPNSPLAQPWPAIVGNTIAALVAVCVCMLVADPVLRIGLSVGLAITATILCRALHPPAGAVAMTAALSPDAVAELGFKFAVTPIATGTIILVLIAIAYAKLTGRHYPLRQFDEPNTHHTHDPEPIERLDLSEDELTEILERYRQSFNLGVEDLARLVGAAELQAATHQTGPLTASDIMSVDLVTIGPDTRAGDVADLFKQHRFASLPVVTQSRHFMGIIFQIHLISQAREDALRLNRRFGPAMKRLLDRTTANPVRAKDIMSIEGPCATLATPIAALLALMSDGDVDAVPVLQDDQIVGIVTRTDLISAMARNSLRQS